VTTAASRAAAQGRLLAEAQMDSTIQFFTPGGEVTDPNTGEVTKGTHVVWAGPCRIRPAVNISRQVDAGDLALFRFEYIVSIPYAVTDVIERLRGTVTYSPDLALAGLTVEVISVARGSSVTARRLMCRVVS